MKIKHLSLIALLLILASAGMAQAVKPDAAVKNLYAAHNGKRSPFFQRKSKARVNQYFTKELADMIWKDAVDSQGEVGALGADPLYDSQDTSRIRKFRIGKPSYGDGNLNVADVEVTFSNLGEDRRILFRLERDRTRKWKVDNIHYTSSASGSLRSLLAAGLGQNASEETEVEGQLHKGRTNSYILYFGRESGDYAAYCFDNDSDVGRAVLGKCKNGDQCKVNGEMADDATCKAPGLEADLSARARIVKVKSVVSRGKQK